MGQEDELRIYNNWQTADNIEVSYLITTDVNNDNQDEMVYTCIENGTRQFLRVQNITNETIIWQIELTTGAQHGIQNLQVADIDDDLMQEIIVINDDFMVYFYTGMNGTLEDSIYWGASGLMAVDDVDSDGDIEIATDRWSSNNSLQIMGDCIVIYNGKDLSVEWESQIIGSQAVVQQLIVDDVDSDGVKEILAETLGCNLTVYDGIDKEVEFVAATNSSAILVVDDLNHDGHKEIITSTWDWPADEELPLQKLLIYNGTDYTLAGTTGPMYNFGFLDVELSDVDGDGVTDIFVIASDGLEDTIFIYNGTDYSEIASCCCNCDVTTISTGNLDEDNDTEIIIGTDRERWSNITRSAQGYVQIVDSTTFVNKWASSNVGTVHGIFISNDAGQVDMIVHSGGSISIFSTSDEPRENDPTNETPGFEIGTIVMGACIALLIQRKSQRKVR